MPSPHGITHVYTFEFTEHFHPQLIDLQSLEQATSKCSIGSQISPEPRAWFGHNTIGLQTEGELGVPYEHVYPMAGPEQSCRQPTPSAGPSSHISGRSTFESPQTIGVQIDGEVEEPPEQVYPKAIPRQSREHP